MKMSILILLAAAGLSSTAYAKSVYSPVERCGANTWSEELYGPYRSDPGGGNALSLPANHGLRAVVVRSTKGTTRIKWLTGNDSRRGTVYYVTSQIILGEDQEYYFCIGRRESLNSIYIETSGGDKAKFRVYTYN